MLALPAAAAAASSSSSSSIGFIHLLCRHRNPSSRVSKALSSSSPPPRPQHRDAGGGHAGLRLEEPVEQGSERSRLDTWISSRIPGVSRARIQASIRSGLVAVNGRTVEKVSQIIKAGDMVCCTVAKLQPLRAEAEDIPLDIVYEDAHVLVVNKPAHMVVHPAPGNANGTLVNAILHHCRLPTVAWTSNNKIPESEECSQSTDDEIDDFYMGKFFIEEVSSGNCEALIRPGIVHRLDKGTSGLLVVAKDEYSHAHLAEQFKQHTIHRVYMSLTSGVPNPSSGRIEMPIARDSHNRLRMAAIPELRGSRHARYAASTK